ncbi:endonuclease/exonuclease/phosphatase family protein [Hoeflea marina]|nr:endonuclease/exonuclease/phosphatase family protein [Hoeflea marina]
MRILSLNAWGGMLHGPLLDWLPTVDADVICLQEISRAPSARGQWLTYRDGAVELQQRAHLFEEIAAALPGHDGIFAPAARGLLMDGDTPRWQHFGLASFIRKELAVTAQALDFVHGGYSPDGFGDHPRPRNAHCMRLCDHAGGSPVTLTHLHGLRDPAGKHDTAARAVQCDRLIELIGRVRRPGDRLIVCGDLNLLPDSRTFAHLQEHLGLADLVTGGGFDDTRTSHYTKPGRFADYMLVSSNVGVKRFEVVAEPEVSDHRPLLLDLG